MESWRIQILFFLKVEPAYSCLWLLGMVRHPPALTAHPWFSALRKTPFPICRSARVTDALFRPQAVISLSILISREYSSPYFSLFSTAAVSRLPSVAGFFLSWAKHFHFSLSKVLRSHILLWGFSFLCKNMAVSPLRDFTIPSKGAAWPRAGPARRLPVWQSRPGSPAARGAPAWRQSLWRWPRRTLLSPSSMLKCIGHWQGWNHKLIYNKAVDASQN